MLNSRYRVLDGLPSYGPPAKPFSETGQGLHREGLVVEFTTTEQHAWVGNFQRGLMAFDAVVSSPTATTIIVVAGGQAYVVSPEMQACTRTFGGQIEHVLELTDRLVFSNGLWLEVTDGERLLWRTRRLSWDGMRNVRVDSEKIVGDAYDPMNDGWTPFEVDLTSGEVLGGSYPPDLPK